MGKAVGESVTGLDVVGEELGRKVLGEAVGETVEGRDVVGKALGSEVVGVVGKELGSEVLGALVVGVEVGVAEGTIVLGDALPES